MRSVWLTLLCVLAMGIASAGTAADGQASESLDSWEEDLEEVTICAADTAECRKVSCIEQCIQTGEDPLDCPSYCILQARNLKAPLNSATRMLSRK